MALNIEATGWGGILNNIPNCKIIIPLISPNCAPVDFTITFRILPEISDSGSAEYQTDSIPGRSSPIYNYNSSGARQISLDLKFMAFTVADIYHNLQNLRAIQSARFPVETNINNKAPYAPPPICTIVMGQILGDDPVKAVLRNYSFKADTGVPWHKESLMPYSFSISTTWEEVWVSSDLPGQHRIFKKGN